MRRITQALLATMAQTPDAGLPSTSRSPAWFGR